MVPTDSGEPPFGVSETGGFPSSQNNSSQVGVLDNTISIGSRINWEQRVGYSRMGNFSYFTQAFGDRYGFQDPKQPGRNLMLCELFEQGVINEVWIEDGESGPRHAPFNAERKQIYDAQNQAVPGSFAPCVGGVVTVIS